MTDVLIYSAESAYTIYYTLTAKREHRLWLEQFQKNTPKNKFQVLPFDTFKTDVRRHILSKIVHIKIVHIKP